MKIINFILFIFLTTILSLNSEPKIENPESNLCKSFGRNNEGDLSQFQRISENQIIINMLDEPEIIIPERFLTSSESISDKADFILYRKLFRSICQSSVHQPTKTNFEKILSQNLEGYIATLQNYPIELKNKNILNFFTHDYQTNYMNNPLMVKYFGSNFNPDLFNSIQVENIIKDNQSDTKYQIISIEGLIYGGDFLKLTDSVLVSLGLATGDKALVGIVTENQIFSIKDPILFLNYTELNFIDDKTDLYFKGYFRFKIIDRNIDLAECINKELNIKIEYADYSKSTNIDPIFGKCSFKKKVGIRTIQLENIKSYLIDLDGKIYTSHEFPLKK